MRRGGPISVSTIYKRRHWIAGGRMLKIVTLKKKKGENEENSKFPDIGKK
jgi:hypothetical protein